LPLVAPRRAASGSTPTAARPPSAIAVKAAVIQSSRVSRRGPLAFCSAMTVRYRMGSSIRQRMETEKEAAMSAGRDDVIVVGARVAGAASAMLLARAGLRVLAVDRVSFPSDTVSSHQLQVPGVALLRRWGLLGKLIAAGTPPARRVRFDAGGGLVLNGRVPAYEGVDALYSPRRSLLDTIVVEAAGEAGAEVPARLRGSHRAA